MIAVLGIAAAVGALAVLLIAVVTNMYRAGSHNNARIGADSTNKLLYALLSHSNFCDAALQVNPGYVGDPLVPPSSTTQLKITPLAPGATNPAANVRIDDIKMPGGSSLMWRGMAVTAWGYNQGTIIDHISFSASPGQTDLKRSTDDISFFDAGATKTYAVYNGYLTLWFSQARYSSAGQGIRPQSFQMTLLTDAAGNLVHCSTANSAQQECWEAGGSLDPVNNNTCNFTPYVNIAGQTCNSAGNISPGGDGCTAAHPGFDMANLKGDGACAPLISFTGFTASGKPWCTCQAVCFDGTASAGPPPPGP